MVSLKDIENMIEHDLKDYPRKEVLIHYLNKQQKEIDRLRRELHKKSVRDYPFLRVTKDREGKE